MPSSRVKPWQTPTKWTSTELIDAVFALEREYRVLLDGALKPHKLTYAQFAALRFIRDHSAKGGTSTGPSDLAAYLDLNTSSVTEITDDLVARRWIKKAVNPDDRRRRDLQVIEKRLPSLAAAEAVVESIHANIYPTNSPRFDFEFRCVVGVMHDGIRKTTRTRRLRAKGG